MNLFLFALNSGGKIGLLGTKTIYRDDILEITAVGDVLEIFGSSSVSTPGPPFTKLKEGGI